MHENWTNFGTADPRLYKIFHTIKNHLQKIMILFCNFQNSDEKIEITNFSIWIYSNFGINWLKLKRNIDNSRNFDTKFQEKFAYFFLIIMNHFDNDSTKCFVWN
jgi:hypothetical protein